MNNSELIEHVDVLLECAVGFMHPGAKEALQEIRARLSSEPAGVTVYAGDAFLRTVSKREAHALVVAGTWDLEIFNRWCCILQGLSETKEPKHD